MERGESSEQNTKTNTRSSLAMTIEEETENSKGNNGDTSSRRPMNEQDQFMPIANVIRIMRRLLPPHAKIADDAKETIQQCVSEYISFITAEANDRCRREQRKTITAEDVLWAMSKLGFDNYMQPLTLYLNRYRQYESERTSVRGEPFVKRTVDYAQGSSFPVPSPAYAPVLPHGPGPGHGHPQGLFNPAAMVNEFYRNAQRGLPGGSSSNVHGLPSFDPYGQFK
ncbi:unnamed protein product [Ilex paraguariensis]|uniref:Transcription factor CBF/NF-Y/archaeal histone domain-containing protein n=1 Tax=Ilex paraguariensis TaxID=185542 RepID=A0ABC8RXV8_9AQUA